MACTSSAPVSFGSFVGPPLASHEICAPEPQWPSTPCVLEISTSMLAASAGPKRAVSRKSRAPFGPSTCGLSHERNAPPPFTPTPHTLPPPSAYPSHQPPPTQ